MPFPVRRAAAFLALLALSGCGFGNQEQFPPVCPGRALLDDAADITRYNGTGRDVTDVILDGRISAVPADCRREGNTIVQVKLNVKATLTRGPASTSRVASVPYFISVLEGDKILDEQDYKFVAAFPPNVDKVTVTGEDIVLRLPVTPEKNASAYRYYIGFRLTPDELAVNRKRGMR